MIDAPRSALATTRPHAEDDALTILPRYAGVTHRAWRELPWSITRVGRTLRVSLEHLREELVADPANREVIMACGAAIANLQIAAHHHGQTLDVVYWPDGRDAAHVAHLTASARRAPRREEEALFTVVDQREAAPPKRPAAPLARSAVARRAMSPALVAVLRHAARTEGGWLDVVSDDARRGMMADLASEAGIIADAERGARHILRARPHAGTAGIRATGTYAGRAAIGAGPSLGELLAGLGGAVSLPDRWDVDRRTSARGSAMEAPLLAVLGDGHDEPTSWLRAGAALQRVLLHATLQGLTATFLNAPLHHPLLRDAVRAILFGAGAPQAIVRFDFGGGDPSVDARRRRALRAEPV